MVNHENTINDSYLITKGIDTMIKISYRNHLIKEFQTLNAKLYSEISALNVADIRDFRKIVSKADEYGYQIFQLTQL